MPHIEPIYYGGNAEVKAALRDAQTKVRQSLQRVCDYPIKQIAYFPRILSREEAVESENMLPLEFRIDVGIQESGVDDERAEALCQWLVEAVPALRTINFGVWLREMTSNGFSEHTPK